MNNIYKILFVFGFCVVIASCSKSSNDEITPIRGYAEQYKTDSLAIETYIDTHYLTYDSDYNVTFDTLLPTSGHSSIRTDNSFSISDTTIVQNGINYYMHFIQFREGTQRRPTQVDSVYVSYKGITLKKNTTTEGENVFDTAQTPIWLKLQEVIPGWANIIPSFKTGTYTSGSGGNPTSYNNYGAGVMFLPSGLAYYNNSTTNISSYSPLIFSFKLYELHYRDHDGDGILSKDERNLTDPASLNLNPLTRWKENPYLGYDYNGDGTLEIYDTDGDGIPNMYDIDDDGDHYTTRSETKKTAADLAVPTGPLGHYPFNPTSTETKGVPNCGNSDFSTSTRLRKYLDPTCHFQE